MKKSYAVDRIDLFYILVVVLGVVTLYGHNDVARLNFGGNNRGLGMLAPATASGGVPAVPVVSPAVAGCLLLMDENPRLPEWLAYHYFAMNLRYLVVHSDPRSMTSPSHILDKWRRHTDMMILEWGEGNYTDGGDALKIQPNTSDWDLFKIYLRRQKMLYRSCTDHFLSNTSGIKYAIYTDPDEYIAIQGRLVGANLTEQALIGQPGSVVTFLDHFVDPNKDVANANLDIAISSSLSERTGTDPPEKTLSRWYKFYNGSICISVPRFQYSSEESTDVELRKYLPRSVSPDLAKSLNTMRYRYQTTGKNLIGKTFINLDQFRSTLLSNPNMTWGAGGPHRTINICPAPWTGWVPISIHHYTGPPEAFLARSASDTRVTTSNWTKEFQVRGSGKLGGVDDEIRPWLQGFVDHMGEKKALFLLEEAGVSGLPSAQAPLPSS
jgi:hypothetical protein